MCVCMPDRERERERERKREGAILRKRFASDKLYKFLVSAVVASWKGKTKNEDVEAKAKEGRLNFLSQRCRTRFSLKCR
jgi:hypothetical protein